MKYEEKGRKEGTRQPEGAQRESEETGRGGDRALTGVQMP